MMKTHAIEEGAAADSQVFLGVDDEGKLFYWRFVQRHGGAFVAIAEPDGCYRLDFPPGTHIASNTESGAPLQDSYDIVYPDGTRLTWYRVMKLDQHWVRQVILAPVDEGNRVRRIGKATKLAD